MYYKNFPICWRGPGYYRLAKKAGLFELIKCGICREAFYVYAQEVISYV